MENNPQTREIATQLSKAIVGTLNQDAGAGQNRTTFNTAVKASPELKGIEPGVIETALRNINFPEMTNSATNRVDASIAPLVVAAKMDSGNTQKSVQGVLENNPQTREIATQLSKAIVTTLNQDAGAGQNRTTFNTAVKASPELKGIEPGVIETALRNINFPEMTNSATNRVDASIAPLVVAAKMDSGNTQKSVQEALENNPQTREIAPQLSKAIVTTLNQDAGAGQNQCDVYDGSEGEPGVKGD